jgi:indole-3-glycerol phosphate synthase
LIETVPDILARIVARKREEVACQPPLMKDWERGAEARLAGRRDFRAALAASMPAIIAECKKASPSKGLLAADYDAAGVARAYERGGAAALSVLTDSDFFQGSLRIWNGPGMPRGCRSCARISRLRNRRLSKPRRMGRMLFC